MGTARRDIDAEIAADYADSPILAALMSPAPRAAQGARTARSETAMPWPPSRPGRAA
jgi:hypothetical protein